MDAHDSATDHGLDDTRVIQRPDLADERNGRCSSRIELGAVSCGLGRVLDVSSDGMRVFARGIQVREEGETFDLTVHAPLGHFAVPARIAWTRSLGPRRIEYGIEFVDLPSEARAQLNLLARGSCLDEDRRAA
ncbi:MAG: PilZ domain-containing protein [Planctomycetota bacterium]